MRTFVAPCSSRYGARLAARTATAPGAVSALLSPSWMRTRLFQLSSLGHRPLRGVVPSVHTSGTGRAGTQGTGVVALHMQVRHQGALNKLLQDPNDVFLSAILEYDIARVAQLAAEDPAVDDDALFIDFIKQNRERLKQSGEQSLDDATLAALEASVAARKHAAVKASPSVLASRDATSPAEAVLQSLYANGLSRLEAREKEEAALLAAMKAACTESGLLSEEEKETLRWAHIRRHRFDALCAANAILRTRLGLPEVLVDVATALAEGVPALEAEEAAAVKAIHRSITDMQERVPAGKWQQDVEPELKELEFFLAIIAKTTPEKTGEKQ